jgi:Phage terminase large subunit (GpA)
MPWIPEQQNFIDAWRERSWEGKHYQKNYRSPVIVNPERRWRCAGSLRLFCESYFAHRITMAWSPDHLKAISKLERAILEGGQFAWAMPRSSGKTTLCEIGCIWAICGGYHAFVFLIGASERAALESLDSIKTELETPDSALGEDWPEVCFPVNRLDGIIQRGKGQLHQGQRTYMSFKKNELVLPTIRGSAASGAILRVAGITGRIRGQKFTRPDGGNVRPSLVVIDDAQTDPSARSLTQIDARERVIAGAVIGLPEPGTKISGIFPCTVIQPGDLADRFLDHDKHPEWQGERFKLLYSFPTNMNLWEQYAEIRDDNLRNGGNGSPGTDFYRDRRVEMDLGAVVAWEQRFLHDEISAVQYAMNLFLTDQAAFMAEYQNEPLLPEIEGGQLKADAVAARVNGVPRGVLPLMTTHLTCYVDVQKKLLYWLVAAWGNDFTGAVVDYGSYPDQGRRYFSLFDARKTLSKDSPGSGLEGSIYAGLSKLADQLLKREWTREDGAAMKIEKLLIDANWGASTDVVYQWCRTTPHSALVMPSHGKYVGPASKPWSEYQRRPGEKLGFHWMIPVGSGKRAVRHLLIDTNFWKTFVAERLMSSVADRGALTLFGKSSGDHQLLSEHCVAEYRAKPKDGVRVVDEWKLRQERPDNHLWDCLVGCAVGASMLGVELGSHSREKKPAQKKRRLSDIYAAKHGG